MSKSSQICKDGPDNATRVLFFKVLANGVRLRIVEALRGSTACELSVGELCQVLRVGQTRVSHELRCLLVCGLVDYRREGKRIIYSLNKKTVAPVLEAADKHVVRFAERMKKCSALSEAKSTGLDEITI